MIRQIYFIATAMLVLAVWAPVGPEPLEAQTSGQCNHCDEFKTCKDGHWDNCEFAGPGHDWGGKDCISGCHGGVCEEEHTDPCSGPLASLTLEDAADLVTAGDWAELAEAALSGRVEFDDARQVLYLRSCNGESLVAQVPLEAPQSEQLVAMVEARQQALLAVLFQ